MPLSTDVAARRLEGAGSRSPPEEEARGQPDGGAPRRSNPSHRTVSSFCGSLFDDGEDHDDDEGGSRRGSSFCGSSMEDDGSPRAALECRMRFFNYNMANNSSPADVAELQGPGGRGHFCAALGEPLADGRPVDVAFASLPETRLFLSEWAQKFQDGGGTGPLNVVVSQNAAQDGKEALSALGGWVDSLAATYNGNLKSVLAFSGGRFAEDAEAMLHGRLGADSKVAGIGVPNPKKAFIGRSIVEHNSGVRFVFAAAHLPVHAVRDALDGPADLALRACKVALARSLRKLLRRASRREILDNRTILFLQGDLNSRTVLHPVLGPLDVMQELLGDTAIQNAMRYDLPIPEGRWYEAARYDSALDLPVTYKYKNETGRAFIQSRDEPGVKISSILEAAKAGLQSKVPGLRGPELYRTTLLDVGTKQLDAWGLSFKEKDFKPLRFPSCADRVLYWAPDTLAERISIGLPRGNYEVNYAQGGSDHRPVSLEVVFRMGPPVEEDPQDVESSGSVSPLDIDRPGGAYRKSMAAAASQDDQDDCGSAPAFISRVISTRESGEASASFADDADVPVSHLVCQSDGEDSDEQREARAARGRAPSFWARPFCKDASPRSSEKASEVTFGHMDSGAPPVRRTESSSGAGQGLLSVPGPGPVRKARSTGSPAGSPSGSQSPRVARSTTLMSPRGDTGVGPEAERELRNRLGSAETRPSGRIASSSPTPPDAGPTRRGRGPASFPMAAASAAASELHDDEPPISQMRSMDDFLRRETLALARQSVMRGSLSSVGGQPSVERENSDLDASLTANVSSDLRRGAQNDRALFELYNSQRKQQESPRPDPDGGLAGSADAFAPADRPRKDAPVSPEKG